MVFDLEKHEYIQLNQLMKYLQWVENGAHANQVIDDGLVRVNGEIEYRRRNKLYAGFVVEYKEMRVMVEKSIES